MGECEVLPSTFERYQQRFSRVLAHIEARSEEQLSIEALSGIAAFSRHHFHRQFSGFLGIRASPDWSEWHSRFRPFIHLRQTTMNTLPPPLVRVVHFPGVRLGVLEHRGSPLRLGDSIRSFIDWRKANKLPPRSSATFNLVYNDPEETPPEDFRFGLGAAIDRAIEPNAAGIVEFNIPAGRCALLRHVGSDDQLGRSILHLYSSWLPGSGEELRDFPLFMQ